MPSLADQQRMVSALQQALGAQLIETHISWVLLSGDYAYKIKKALDLGFLDYLHLASRKFLCIEELRLNRRTAPDMYLEVVGIGGSAEAPVLGVQPAIEYAVKMRRFPADMLLDECLQRGDVTAAHIDALASTVATFHAQAAVADVASPYGDASGIRAAAMQNFEQMRSLLKDAHDLQQLAAIEQQTEAEWQACRTLFASRRASGLVRECHGDMHLGNIALIDDAPVPFDCIEFSPALRWIDVMDEVAFTMMDLLYHARSDLAWRYLNAYLQTSGDYEGMRVLRFYLAYRAAVRAKIAAIRASQSTRGRAQHLRACRGHLALATRCLADRHPAMIITHGLPGSGKTTFAQYALEQLGAVRIRSDVERKRLFGLAALQGSTALATDIYSHEATVRTYDRLLELSRAVTDAGYTVVVDAAFLKQQERERFETTGLPFAIASLAADEQTLRSRIRMRKHDASEADVSVLERLKAGQQALTDVESGMAARFDTGHGPQSGENARSWQRLLKLLKR